MEALPTAEIPTPAGGQSVFSTFLVNIVAEFLVRATPWGYLLATGWRADPSTSVGGQLLAQPHVPRGERREDADDEAICGQEWVWQEIYGAMRAKLAAVSLSDLVDHEREHERDRAAGARYVI